MSFILVFSAISAAAFLGAAQEGTPTYTLEQALQICSKVKDSHDRLACFEGLAKSAASDSQPSASAVDEQPPVAAAPAVSDDVADAPLAKPEAPVAAQAPQGDTRYVIMRADEYEGEKRRIKKERVDPQPYAAVVLRAWEYANGEFFIALTNGEIWRNNDRVRTRRVKDGMNVTLKPGGIGGWFIHFADNRPPIRVKLVE